MSVYILHFDRPYQHARHYVGYADDVEDRIWHHRNGTGARLMQVIRDAGIGFQIARIWEGADRTFERRLKNCKHTDRYCPMCHQRARDYRPRD